MHKLHIVRHLSGCGHCSLPAPGFFNDDDTVDFMLHLNHGVYPDYDYSTVRCSLCLQIMLHDFYHHCLMCG